METRAHQYLLEEHCLQWPSYENNQDALQLRNGLRQKVYMK
jgi:hypothetical protein